MPTPCRTTSATPSTPSTATRVRTNLSQVGNGLADSPLSLLAREPRIVPKRSAHYLFSSITGQWRVRWVPTCAYCFSRPGMLRSWPPGSWLSMQTNAPRRRTRGSARRWPVSCGQRSRAWAVRRWRREVMSTEPCASARRVSRIAGNGASYRGWTAAARLYDAWPDTLMMNLPVHVSWLSQAEICFSVIQRKLLASDDFTDRRHPRQPAADPRKRRTPALPIRPETRPHRPQQAVEPLARHEPATPQLLTA